MYGYFHFCYVTITHNGKENKKGQFCCKNYLTKNFLFIVIKFYIP
jgi:hypothetical protein